MKNERDALRENKNKNSLEQKLNNSQISTRTHELNITSVQNPNDNLKIGNNSFEKDINIDIGEIQENYLKIFENFYIGITIADNNERIIYWNKYAEELLKMDEKELFLKDVCSLYPQEEWDKIRAENVRQKGIKNKKH